MTLLCSTYVQRGDNKYLPTYVHTDLTDRKRSSVLFLVLVQQTPARRLFRLLHLNRDWLGHTEENTTYD